MTHPLAWPLGPDVFVKSHLWLELVSDCSWELYSNPGEFKGNTVVCNALLDTPARAEGTASSQSSSAVSSG